MMKIFAVALFAMFAMCRCGERPRRRSAEPMPGTNYTDMPPYHPALALPVQTIVRACSALMLRFTAT